MKQRLQTLVFLLSLFSSLAAFAGNRFWTGGTGSWSDPAHWSLTSGGDGGAGVPSVSDDVIFDENSFSSAADRVEISGQASCRIFLWKSLQGGIRGNGSLNLAGLFFANDPVDQFTGQWAVQSTQLIFRAAQHQFTGSVSLNAPVNGILFDDSPQVANARSGSGSHAVLSHTVTTVVTPNLCNGQCTATAQAVVTGGSGNFSYQWSTVPVQNTQTATGLCAGTYLVVVTDLTLGDQVAAFAIVVDPPPLVIFFSNTSPLCNGQCNATSSASVAGGTPGYTYDWLPGTPTGDGTPNVINLCAGTYSLHVTDINGCQVTQMSIITQPAVLQPNGVRTNVTCFGLCDGTAQVAPTGGTVPYSYLWAPGGQTTPAITGVCPGSYTCTVTDVNNCTATYVATITQPSPLQASISHTNVLCNGQCNGTANSSVSGGTGPYTYNWNPGSQTTPNLTGLCAGSYTLTVTDANNCQTTVSVTITQPSPLVLNPTSTNISCFGQCNGTATANASGGTLNYTYAWSNGPTTAVVTGLCPNTYTVNVTDANGCQANAQVTITQPAQLLAGATRTNVTCNGACDGTANSSPLGGTPPYTYLWNPGNLTTPGITNLCPGSYTLTVTDINNCTANATVTITQPPLLVPNLSSVNVTCNGICNGSASASPSGGVGPYSYLWMPGGQTSSSINSLCAGTYTLTVTDANNCQRTQQFTITEPNLLNVTVNATQLACNSTCSGAAAALVSGGTAAYTYLWSPGGQTTASIGSLCAGSYTVQVTDANGCIDTSSVLLTQPTALTLTNTITGISCNGSCDGSITINPSGGTPAYTYNWAPGGQTTPTVGSLCSGIYTVTVTDANSCNNTATIVLTQPVPLSAGLTSQNVTCNGGCNGTAASNPSGGTAPYSFLWAPGGQTTSSISGLCVGSYTCTVTDANGCTRTQIVSITQPSPLSAQVASTTSSCGICNGTASVAVFGGTSPYAYFWTPGGQTNPTATGLCIGSYTCTVTDAAGCTTTAVATVSQVVNIVVSNTSTSLSCFGACDGVASANATGGSAPYTYIWAPGGQTTQTITNLCAGTYTVTATDANGCFNSAVVTFADPPALTVTSVSSNASCNGVCDGTASVSASGGTGTFTYLWAPGGQTTASVSGLCAGTYTATVRDGNNCAQTVTISITQPPLIAANATTVPANCTLCDGSISTTASGGSGTYTYSWAPGGQTTSSVSSLCPGVYTVTITDNSGCSVNSPVAVGNLNGPSVLAASANASCNAVCNGSASVNVTGGTAPFAYDWLPGSPAGDGTPAVTALCAGTYFCQVTDGVGCISFATINITEPSVITAVANITNASCNGVCNGSISITPSGGTGPYTYLWAPGGQTTPAINNLCAGIYTVTITDNNGCTQNLQFTVTEPGVLSSAISFNDVTCNGTCNGNGTISPSGGSTPYTYSWSSGQGTPSAFNLCPGGYTVTVTDAGGCTTSQQFSITEPPALISSITHTDASCNGLCDGTATVIASGGTGAFSYTWSPGGGTTPSASGLCPGAYSVLTSDANGCISVSSVTILQPTAISINMTANATSCFNVCNGTASASVTGGTGAYTYSWAPGGQTTPGVTGLCAGIYTITVTDANSCSSTQTTSVTQPALLQANVSSTSTSCNGTCDGTATSNPIGGAAPYQYLWAPGGQTTASVSGLCAGTYTVTVRDASGCQDVQIITVSAASSIAVTIASAPANCGSCNGTISLSPSGGQAPYTYSWSNALPPQANQTNLCAGLYTVVVTDANACATTFTIPMNNNGGPTGETVTVTAASCNAACDASATIVPSGGLPPYSYLWIPGGQTTPTVTNICAGNYFVQVTDANGCIRFSPVTVNGPQPLIASPFVANASCTGICDGSISTTPSGGTGPYSFSWAPGGQTTQNISGLCIGTYTLTMTDANGCSQNFVATVNAWNNLTTVVATSPIGCANVCSGTAQVTPTGGTGPYTYQWNDPLSQVTQTASSLCAGTYTAVITDANGCNTTATASITNSTPITAVLTPAATSCGQCNGSVSLVASGGIPPYTYQWSNGAVSQNVSGLCAGVYGVTVTDAGGCTATFSVGVTSSNAPATNLTQTNVSCGGLCDGTALVSPTGGTPPYTYNWIPGAQTTASVNSLCAGTYFVQVQDAAGCIATQSLVITQPSVINANAVITNTDCGVCNGSVSLTPSGGTGPYTYLWAPGGQTTATISNLCAGLYTVTITDATGCSRQQVIPVSNVNSTMVLTNSPVSVTCGGACDGGDSVAVAGGVAPFTYLWSNGSTSQVVNGLCAGTYFVQVTDANGCVSTLQSVITEPSPLSVSMPFLANESCFGSCNGVLTALPSGGILPYSYSWSNGPVTATAGSLCAGSYTVTVSDPNGCTITQSATITSPAPLLSGNPVITNSSCNTVNDGAIDISIGGGTAPYAFAWTGPGTFTASTEDLTAIFNGSYTVTVTDANGCTLSDTILVNATVSVIAFAGNDTAICNLLPLTLDGSLSTNASSFQWFELPGNILLSSSSGVTVSPATTTSYVLVATNGSCSSSDTITITQLPPIAVDAGPTSSIIAGQAVTIGGNPTGPSGSAYSWGPSAGLGSTTASNPTASPAVTTTYTVTATDPGGCSASDTVTVIVVPEIKFPNGFTPNNDGVNDVWEIDNIQLFPNCVVEVYNRWGEMLFQSPGYTKKWDGRYDGKDLPAGTYYYIIRLNDPHFPTDYTGPITILR